MIKIQHSEKEWCIMNSCSFCGREESHNVQLVEGADGNICRECAEVVIEEFLPLRVKGKKSAFMKPHEIKEELDKHVIGQEAAKKMIAVNVYNHYKRLSATSHIDIQKSNMLLVGPSGSGKTFLIQKLAEILDIPLVIADATQYTIAGYVGKDVESIIEQLLARAKGDVEKAEKGIVYIDEVDKLSSEGAGDKAGMKEVGGRGVQEALLKLIEDQDVDVSTIENGIRKTKTVSTKNILFVFGGAFVGLDKIIKKRTNQNQKRIGFAQQGTNEPTQKKPQNKTSTITSEDLITYGIIPELVGRIPAVATLNPLTEQDLINILTKPKHAVIKQYQALLKMDGVNLKFHKDALTYIARQTMERKTGARGLKGVIESKMYDLMYHVPKRDDLTTITITKEMLENDDWEAFLNNSEKEVVNG